MLDHLVPELALVGLLPQVPACIRASRLVRYHVCLGTGIQRFISVDGALNGGLLHQLA